MALTIGGTARRIGLALSGGGFRAAAFHLGVMRRLAALGILEHVDLFTCVSGGSIAGAGAVVFLSVLRNADESSAEEPSSISLCRAKRHCTASDG